MSGMHAVQKKYLDDVSTTTKLKNASQNQYHIPEKKTNKIPKHACTVQKKTIFQGLAGLAGRPVGWPARLAGNKRWGIGNHRNPVNSLCFWALREENEPRRRLGLRLLWRPSTAKIHPAGPLQTGQPPSQPVCLPAGQPACLPAGQPACQALFGH